MYLFPVAKKRNFGQILTCEGLLYWPPFSDEGQTWCARADPRCAITVKFRLDRFILSPSGLRQFVVSLIGGNLRKLTCVHNYYPSPGPLSNGIKVLSVLQRLDGDIGRTNSDLQKRDRQRDRKISFLPPRRRMKSEPHQTWHDDRGPWAPSCTSKSFGDWCTVSPLGGTENLR